jgi:hypothetical protein
MDLRFDPGTGGLAADSLHHFTHRLPHLSIGGAEITTHEFQRIPFLVDFTLGPYAESPEQADRGTPTLQGVLKEERRDGS